ncbi:t-SNARE [Leucosporidium creatinivorum]|uniref:t-SNARE n=1 Tax=Leucosporidium creatinivorum TaxID=106004 RepID=A0A1Y2FL98_9BASI|nr:t-SNARE [Leucosporidium creatinivorum]
MSSHLTNPSAPYTRSRTNLFLSYRDSAIRPSAAVSPRFHEYDDASESRGLLDDLEAGVESRRGSLLPGGGGGARQVEKLPPKWVDLADRVEEVVERVKPKIAHLDKLHAKHILPGFKDRSAEEREIDALANEITRDFRLTQMSIRQIAEISKTLLSTPARGAESAEAKRLDLIMAANVQTALATKVQEISGVFRKKQTAYLRQLKGHESRASALGGSNSASTSALGQDPLASLADDEQYSLQAQQSLSQSSHTAALSQRDSEISSIAQSIVDLSDLFKDLSSLVIDQGTLLDRVDWNVEQMGGEVRGAVEELKEATNYQRRSGKCQLIFLLILLIFACIIIILYKPSRHSSPPPAPAPTGKGGSSTPMTDEAAAVAGLTGDGVLDGRGLRRRRLRVGLAGAKEGKWNEGKRSLGAGPVLELPARRGLVEAVEHDGEGRIRRWADWRAESGMKDKRERRRGSEGRERWRREEERL